MGELGSVARIEDIFHLAMIQTYHDAKKYCDYNPTRFYQKVIEKGGLAAAKEFLSSEKPQSGLTTLWECGRLDISMEAHVINPQFESLFTEDERETARKRLVDYGWED